MKSGVMIVWSILMFLSINVLAQSPTPVPVNQGVIGFLGANWGLIVAVLVAVLDLLFAVSPSTESNGLLHSVYLWLKGLKKS